MSSFFELFKREIYRFLFIWVQTILAPVSTAVLYQLIFGQQLATLPTGVPGVSYSTFLIPGLVMMQVLLNSFGNGSSSLLQSKYNGNIIFTLMAPITPLSIYCAYLLASIIRGVIIGIAVIMGIGWFGIGVPQAPLVMIYFLVMGAAVMGGLGLILGILCDTFDQMAGFQSFIIVPLIYLAGVFYNVSTLHGIWHYIALINPFLHIVDGFRYGFIAHASYDLVYGAVFTFFGAVIINVVGYLLIKYGVKIKH